MCRAPASRARAPGQGRFLRFYESDKDVNEAGDYPRLALVNRSSYVGSLIHSDSRDREPGAVRACATSGVSCRRKICA